MSTPSAHFPSQQQNDQPDMVEVTHHPDGSGVMRLAANGSIERDVDGNFNINFPKLKRIEIADITTVMSHQVNRLLNSTSHVIHLVGGGCFTIAYDQHGTLLYSRSSKIVCSFTDDGVVRLERSFRESDQNSVSFGGKEL